MITAPTPIPAFAPGERPERPPDPLLTLVFDVVGDEELVVVVVVVKDISVLSNDDDDLAVELELDVTPEARKGLKLSPPFALA